MKIGFAKTLMWLVEGMVLAFCFASFLFYHLCICPFLPDIQKEI